MEKIDHFIKERFDIYQNVILQNVESDLIYTMVSLI